jgi:hypothetical protein
MLLLSNKITGDDLTASEWDNHAKELENIVTKNNIPLDSKEDSLYNAVDNMLSKPQGRVFRAKSVNYIEDDVNKTYFHFDDEYLVKNPPKAGDTIYIELGDTSHNTLSKPYVKIGDNDKMPLLTLEDFYLNSKFYNTINSKNIGNAIGRVFPLRVAQTYYYIPCWFTGSQIMNYFGTDAINPFIELINDNYIDEMQFSVLTVYVSYTNDLNTIELSFNLRIDGNDTKITDNIVKGKIIFRVDYLLKNFFKKFVDMKNYQSRSIVPLIFQFTYNDSDDSQDYTFPNIINYGRTYYRGSLTTEPTMSTKILELDGTKDVYNQIEISGNITLIGSANLLY